MSFFNRQHAAQGFEILAAICGLFSSLATTEALAISVTTERPIALLIAGAAALSVGAGIASGKARMALHAFLIGPFIACVLLACAVLLSEISLGQYAGNQIVVSSAFAAGALVLYLAIRALRKP
ncbi:hypothetical protein [Rubrivivax gelatinosus]|uniref:hypothetical protein n=1 Tax=Rubrivivax gelatinosus TaxID=28068 RepID=UPI001906D4BC|nr:hypothetical protein [Rubrivivax gelatinosus]